MKEEDDVNAHSRRQHDQRGRNAGPPDQRRAGDKERHNREENHQPNTDQLPSAARQFKSRAAGPSGELKLHAS